MASKNYIFYKIFKEDLDEVYVGCTSNFDSRKKDHKKNCYNENNKQYNYKIYQIIRANGGWDEFKMIQIGTRENITKREAEQIEEEYRLELKASMNTIRAFLSPEVNKEYHKQYYQDNKERISEHKKEYRQTNKDLILEYKKEYYQDNKEHILEYQKDYRQTNKERISEQHKEHYQANKDLILEHKKEYYQDNKEHILEHNKEYKQTNKEKISEKGKEKIICEICNIEITRNSKSRHMKSQKHINNI